MAEFIFYFLAISVCISALLTVTARQIFHSAIWLSMCLLSIAGIYFYLHAEFIGVIQVLVYIGGIITLFIFAIKLTARINDPLIQQANRQVIPSFLVSAILFGIIFCVMSCVSWPLTEGARDLTLKELGRLLMTNYALPFEFISILLLAVMIGAIVIGKAGK